MKPPRPGEVAIPVPETGDAHIHFLGRIHTPWKTLSECPKTRDGRAMSEAVIEVDPPYDKGLAGIALFSHVIVLYWLDESPRGLIVQHPSHLDAPRGVFALRSPARPNPIGHAVAEIVRVEANRITVRGLDARDGTPLIDLKPYFPSIDAFPDARRP